MNLFSLRETGRENKDEHGCSKEVNGYIRGAFMWRSCGVHISLISWTFERSFGALITRQLDLKATIETS